MIRYLFVGLQYNKKLEKEYLYLCKHGLSAASNEFQWNLCDGFIQCVGRNFEILTALPVGCFPRHYQKAYLESTTWDYRGSSVSEISSWNFPVLKQLTREYKCAVFLQKWIDESPEDQHVVIIYSLYLPYLKAIQKIKKRNKAMRGFVIVPDLPGKYGILPSNPIRAQVAARLGYRALKLAESLDGYVVLTEKMTHPLRIFDKPYVVVEGICNQRQASIPSIPGMSANDEKHSILYAGTLHRQFGIITLLEAFNGLKSDTELWICGAGDCEAEVRAAAEKDKRIRFFGYISSDEVDKLRSQATVLVNPRPNEGEYTKYSFPSKTMGYMASGKLVVMNKLAGIPNEYDEYLLYPRDNSAEALANTLEEALAMSCEDRRMMGEKARKFVLGNKNAVVQARRILEMINEF